MAPSGRTRTKPKPKPKPKPRITNSKKRLSKSKNIQETSIVEDLPSSSSTTTSLKIDGFNFEGVDDDHISTTTSACSTPKAQKFRIPEIVTCPPAPKKQRMISNCSLQRRPIAFFAPPDLELFFFYALHDISV